MQNIFKPRLTPMIRTAIGSFIAVAVSGSSLHAAEINMNPGMWETTVVMESELMGTKTHTTKECMTKEKFDPENMYKQMLKDMPDANCDGPHSISGNTMNIDMTCTMQGGAMNMKGSWTFNGDEGSGNMTMGMDMGGMKMTMKMESTGRRIGDC